MARKLPTLVVPQTASIPVNDIPAPEWLGVRREAEVLAALRFDPSHPNYGAVRGAASPSQRTANRQAIQLAADDAASSDGTLVIKGEYEIDETLHLRCHVDGDGGTVRVDNTTLAPVILFGTRDPASDLRYKVARMPNVIQAGKRALGLGIWGSDVGIEFSNLNSCRIITQQVQGFERNILLTAWGKGHCYNEYHFGHLDNGKIGLDIYPAGTNGWINENNFYGGRWSINGGEGSNIPGSRHIRIRDGVTYGVNNSVFHKTSIEGNGPEYHLESAGHTNKFDHCRWEASPPKVLLRPPARDDVFLEGYDSWKIVWTIEPGARPPAVVRTRAGQIMGSSGAWNATFAGAHGSPSSPVFAVLDEIGAALTNDHRDIYRIALSTLSASFKIASDTHPRLRIQTTSGQLAWGDGASEPSVTFGRYGNTTLRSNVRILSEVGFGTGGYTDGAPSGTPKGSIPIYDDTGQLLGRIPVY